MSLGWARYAKGADVLLDVLADHPMCYGAAFALGRMGEKRAVPAVIRAAQSGCQSAVRALGILATPEAVDFLIANIELRGASEALGKAGDRRALPVLEHYLEAVSAKGWKHDIASTRIAIERLRQRDPVPVLLSIGENSQEGYESRAEALLALGDYVVEPMVPRILKLYKRDSDTNIRRYCIWLLKNSPSDEVTEALVQHATAIADTDRDKDDLATMSALLEALNERLHLDFDDVRDMHDYCVQRKK
jgi:HEAT repeat protein